MRRVNCVGQRSGNPLPDFRCTAPKPLSMERCRNLGPCFTSPVWDFDPWTQVKRERELERALYIWRCVWHTKFSVLYKLLV